MALITASEARTLGGINLSGTGSDTKIESMITQAEQQIADFLGLPEYGTGLRSWEDQTYTIYYDGEGGHELDLGIRPVQSITSLYVDAAREYASSTLVDSGDYTLDGSRGVIVLDFDADPAAFPRWQSRAIKVTFVAGWATVPDWLKQVCAEWVAALWAHRNSKQAGQLNRSGRAGSIGFRDTPIPPHLYDALRPYRNATAG